MLRQKAAGLGNGLWDQIFEITHGAHPLQADTQLSRGARPGSFPA
jgi:hypothetical protein